MSAHWDVRAPPTLPLWVQVAPASLGARYNAVSGPPRASEPESTLTRAPELCVRMGNRDMGSKASLGFLR